MGWRTHKTRRMIYVLFNAVDMKITPVLRSDTHKNSSSFLISTALHQTSESSFIEVDGPRCPPPFILQPRHVNWPRKVASQILLRNRVACLPSHPRIFHPGPEHDNDNRLSDEETSDASVAVF